MEKLTTPSRDVALQILQEVDFEDRLIGTILHLRAGVRILSLYSLEDLFLFLKEPYPQIDVAQVENWIRATLNDGELADKIKTVILREAGTQDTVHSIRDLVGWRLIQCKQIAGK